MLTYNSAFIRGTVNPEGCETTYTFEFRQSGGSWSGELPSNAGSENQNLSVWAPRASLQPTTKYEYRLVATNTSGTSTTSSVESFTTPHKPGGPAPSVTTQAATGVTSGGATLNGLVNPNGLSTTYVFEYGTKTSELNKSTAPLSAGSGSSNVKVEVPVGLESGTLYYFRLSATNAAATTKGSDLSFTTSASLWKIKEAQNPGEHGNRLYDVSCEPGTSACTAVGKSTKSFVDSPVTLRWNGSAWSEQTPVKKSGATHTRLFGVDCPSETRCMAVGNYQSSEGASVFTELWNEGSWTVRNAPLPAESTASEFVAVGCNSTANCTAVGSATIGGVKQAIAQRWNSPNWAVSPVPIPEGAKSSQLDGVDCLWSNFCVAVGRYTNESSKIKSLAMLWNGTEWSLQSGTDPLAAAQSTLLDVACTPSPSRCTAVGSWANIFNPLNQFPLVYRFNGVSTWTQQSAPVPSGSSGGVLQDVSCASETSCAAAGSWVSAAGGSNMTLAEDWDGTTWSIQPTPNPVGALSSTFSGLSCRSTSCMGVGWSTNASGVTGTLTEFRE